MRNSHKHNLKRITLELGGKSPNIILDDADMDLAIQQSQLGIYFNHGQCCIAGSRVFVQEGIYDEFVSKTKQASELIKVGNQFDDHVA
jgi:aldehyde dehydrogenase (NAD+)